jgi:hypothetical protein
MRLLPVDYDTSPFFPKQFVRSRQISSGEYGNPLKNRPISNYFMLVMPRFAWVMYSSSRSLKSVNT